VLVNGQEHISFRASEFFVFLLLGPLGSARKSKHERHPEMLEQFRARRSKLASSSGNSRRPV